ncbi:MAG: germination lipoprotein GerS-related protein [Bacillota bacterium]|nr:germination lipoprotein GerS-related protein [Bacillota bacterium]
MRILKKIFTIALVLLSVIALGCGRKQKSEREVLEYLKNIQSYKCKATINILNNKQAIQYKCTAFYDEKLGARLEIGEDRIFIYKDNWIHVSDKASGRKYSIEESFDNLYYLAFVNKYIKLMYTNEDTKYYVQEESGRKYQLIELTIPDNNINMAKAVLYVDAKTLVPGKIMIYDNKDKERIRINYSEFAANEKLDSNLFNFQ